jgi:iron-sulfur cluster assembly protein
VNLTDAAISQATKKAETDGETLIRIGVKPSGCNGYEYTFNWDDTVTVEDYIKEYTNFSIVIDKESQPYFENATLDFTKEGLTEQFKIINPLEETQCGCGVSVGFKKEL